MRSAFLLLTLGLAGCANAPDLASVDWSKAIANYRVMKQVAGVVTCEMTQGAMLAGNTMAAVDAGKAAMNDAGKIVTAGMTVCRGLGGVPIGK